MKIIKKNNKKLSYFRNLNSKERAKFLIEANDNIKRFFLNKINSEEFKDIQKYLHSEEITDLLSKVNEKKREKFLLKLPIEKREKVSFFLKFPSGSIGKFINTNFIKVDINDDFEVLVKKIKNFESIRNKEPVILVYEGKFFLGELLIHKLLVENDIKASIKKLPEICYDIEFEDAIKLVKKKSSKNFVVVDENNRVLGIIESKDFLKYFDKELTKNFYQFGGVRSKEHSFDNFLTKFKNRFPWLTINLFTAYLAAYVVSYFDDTISKMVILAAYMPIVAGMGGNAATQTLAIVIRGLTLDEFENGLGKVLLNELLSGFLNGFIIGLITGIIALVFNKSYLLGLIVFLAMIINLLVAAFFGTIVPLVLDSLDIDPAKSSSIFITTATDVFGFLAFLGLAKFFIG